MGRRSILPDPKSRSTNEPMVIIGPIQIRALYNQSYPRVRLSRVNEISISWVVEQCRELGWDEIRVKGHQILLVKTFK